jgi:hypothetical protein
MYKIALSLSSAFFLLPLGLSAATSSAGDVVNEAVIGAPFYGFTSDASGAVRNAVGPTADFIRPMRLIARSGDSKVNAGSATQLASSLLLDDGTVTNLPSEEVAWAVDTALATVSQSGLLTATQVTDRVRVTVSATAEGLTAEVRVRLEPNAAPALQIPAALVNSSEAAGGWRTSTWFGNFYATENSWLHHAELGWLYMQQLGDGSVWMWDKNHQWLWTGQGVYPHLYRAKDSTWLYFMLEALPNKAFYNHSTKLVETAQP